MSPARKKVTYTTHTLHIHCVHIPHIHCTYTRITHILHIHTHTPHANFPGGSVVKHPPANVGDSSSIFGSGRSPGEGNGNSFHYFSLENSIDRRAQWVTVHGVTKV